MAPTNSAGYSSCWMYAFENAVKTERVSTGLAASTCIKDGGESAVYGFVSSVRARMEPIAVSLLAIVTCVLERSVLAASKARDTKGLNSSATYSDSTFTVETAGAPTHLCGSKLPGASAPL